MLKSNLSVIRAMFLAVLMILICFHSLNAVVNGQSTATISGTVRCGGGCSAFGLAYGDPVNVAGKVVAVMTMALDPYTGAARPDLPVTNAKTSFDASASGQYVLQGLLPGVFDLYASANGFQLALVQSGITVHGGEILHFDAYLIPCPGPGC